MRSDDSDAALRTAAERGEAGAAARWAVQLFRTGRRADAMPWLKRASSEGDAQAQYLLGVALYNGDGVDCDPARARALLAAAAAAGVAQAENALRTIAMQDRPPVADALVSAAAADRIAADLARLSPAPDNATTLATMLERQLIPLLRERLEDMLPTLVRTGVERRLTRTPPDQPSPVKS